MNSGNGYKSIVYAARFSALGHIGGKLAIVVALLCVPPIAVAIYFQEYAYIQYSIPVICVLFLAGWLGRYLPKPQQLLRSEGYIITCASFILTPIAISFTLIPCGLTLEDRLFEAISGITTTGLSTVANIEAMDKTFLFTRTWMQWYGGLGIVVLSITLLMSRSLASYHLLELPEGADFVSSITVYARHILKIYLFLTLVVLGICWASVESGFDALQLAFSAISTGGFAPTNASLSQLPIASQLVVMICGVLGAVSLPIYLRLRRGAWRQVLHNGELRLFLILLVGICVLLSSLLITHYADSERGLNVGVILGLSALSTTGFTNADIQSLSSTVKLVVIAAMFIGGSLGSTAGGFKVFRLQVFSQLLITTLRKASAPPHAVIEARIQGRAITPDQIQIAMLTGTLLVGCIIFSWLVFLYYGYNPMDSLFEVTSAVGTVGLSAGVVSADMPVVLKTVLCVDMIAGRVEVLALLCLLYPGIWTGIRNPAL